MSGRDPDRTPRRKRNLLVQAEVGRMVDEETKGGGTGATGCGRCSSWSCGLVSSRLASRMHSCPVPRRHDLHFLAP